MARLGVIGAGFVADHYMRSRATFPDLELVGAYDVSAERLEQFCKGWNRSDRGGRIILNLTNPSARYEVSRQCLEAGSHLYAEKSLALSHTETVVLAAAARSRGCLLVENLGRLTLLAYRDLAARLGMLLGGPMEPILIGPLFGAWRTRSKCLRGEACSSRSICPSRRYVWSTLCENAGFAPLEV